MLLTILVSGCYNIQELLFGLHEIDKEYRVFSSQIDSSWKWSIIHTRSMDVGGYITVYLYQ